MNLHIICFLWDPEIVFWEVNTVLKKIYELLRQNSVLLKFYFMFGYFCLLFYFFLHWKVSEDYIATYLPIVMAKSVVAVLNIFGVGAEAIQQQVKLPGFSFTIIYHCAGIFGMMIYASAVIAYPSKLIEKIYGLIVGWIGLYAINTIRMAALGIIGMKWRKHFDFYHEYLWQGIFIIFVIAFWIFWKEKMIREPDIQAPNPDKKEVVS
jgi:exosortase/archaeosortase family protein